MALGAPAGAGATYTVVDIGILPGASNITPKAMNDAGEVVGWTQGPGSLLRAFVWRPGEGISELPPPDGFTYSIATDITEGGLILGRAQAGIVGTSARGWIWDNGTYTLLPPFPAACTGIDPRGLNDRREVVGTTCPDAAAESAFFWSDTTGYINLTTLYGLYPASDINEAGEVAAGSGAGAVRWSMEGGVELLGTLEAPYDDSAHGTAINQLGDVAGISEWGVTGPNHWRAFLFTDRMGIQNVAPTGAARAAAWGINDVDDVVGTMGSESSGDFTSPWLWSSRDGFTFVSELVDDPRFINYYGVADINNAGQIVLEAQTDDPADLLLHAVVLTPQGGPVAADLDGDGDVDGADLGMLLGAWGRVDGDLNGDGIADGADLGILLGAWTG